MTGFEWVILILVALIAWIAWRCYRTLQALQYSIVKIMADEEMAAENRWNNYFVDGFLNLNDIRVMVEGISDQMNSLNQPEPERGPRDLFLDDEDDEMLDSIVEDSRNPQREQRLQNESSDNE